MGKKDQATEEIIEKKDEEKKCGIVMPISAMDNCSESHWTEVLGILHEAIADAGFVGNLVSSANEVGIIHERIIRNLYHNPIVICDVSLKNPNVMFELGLRLAFDKPTIIIKDNKTSYSFDTSVIEHLEYPRDLRFGQIVEFKESLAEKIKNTYENSTKGGYTTFLKHFGELQIEAATIEKKDVSGQEFMINELRKIGKSFDRLERREQLSNISSSNQNFTQLELSDMFKPWTNTKHKILFTLMDYDNNKLKKIEKECMLVFEAIGVSVTIKHKLPKYTIYYDATEDDSAKIKSLVIPIIIKNDGIILP
jgi:uncharacterized protein YkvS